MSRLLHSRWRARSACREADDRMSARIKLCTPQIVRAPYGARRNAAQSTAVGWLEEVLVSAHDTLAGSVRSDGGGAGGLTRWRRATVDTGDWK